MMENEEIQSKTVAFLRFPLIILVVMAHFNIVDLGLNIHGVVYGTNKPLWFHLFFSFFTHTLAGLCVPLFFFIAGYYFFNKKDFSRDVYKSNLKKRIHTLLIPYITWNFLAILFIAIRFMPGFSSMLPGVEKIQVNLTMSGVLHAFYDNYRQEGLFIYPNDTNIVTMMPIDGPLWFVRELMIMALLSPLLYRLIRKLKFISIIMLGVLTYIISPIFFPNSISTFFDAIFYFSWGAYYSISKKIFILEMQKIQHFSWLYIPAAVIDTITTGQFNNIFHYASVPIGVVFVIILTSYLIKKGVIHENSFLSNSSFFIYAMHTLIIWELGKILFIMIHVPDYSFTMLIYYFFVIISTIFVCLLAYQLLKRYVPAIHNILTGGR